MVAQAAVEVGIAELENLGKAWTAAEAMDWEGAAAAVCQEGIRAAEGRVEAAAKRAEQREAAAADPVAAAESLEATSVRVGSAAEGHLGLAAAAAAVARQEVALVEVETAALLRRSGHNLSASP